MTVPEGPIGKKVDQYKLHVYMWNNRDRMSGAFKFSQKKMYNALGVTKKHMSDIYTSMSNRGWITKIPGTNTWLIHDPKKFQDID